MCLTKKELDAKIDSRLRGLPMKKRFLKQAFRDLLIEEKRRTAKEVLTMIYHDPNLVHTRDLDLKVTERYRVRGETPRPIRLYPN